MALLGLLEKGAAMRVTLSYSHGDKCASDGCNRVAVVHFEAGDVGSDYCSTCMDKIRKQYEKDAPKCVGCRMPLVEGISLFMYFGPPTPADRQGYWHMRCHQISIKG